MNLLDVIRASLFDLVHNVDTEQRVPLAELEVVGGNKESGRQYFPTLPKSMGTVLHSISNDEIANSTFIDIGCGKGLTLLIAARYPFRRIIGVEFSVKLCSIARSNVKSYRGRLIGPTPEISCQDATDFTFPSEPLVVYFFNPFTDQIMATVLSSLRASIDKQPRAVTVICDRLHNHSLFRDLLRPDTEGEVSGFAVYRVN